MYQVIINGGTNKDHGTIISTHKTRQEAEQAASRMQAETREANGNTHAYLDLRIDACAPTANTRLWAFVNCAANNRNAGGDTLFFVSKERRDAEMLALRANAVARGLSRDAAHAGIYPITVTVGEAWANEDEYRNIASMPVMVDCADVGQDESLASLAELAEGFEMGVHHDVA